MSYTVALDHLGWMNPIREELPSNWCRVCPSTVGMAQLGITESVISSSMLRPVKLDWASGVTFATSGNMMQAPWFEPSTAFGGRLFSGTLKWSFLQASQEETPISGSKF